MPTVPKKCKLVRPHQIALLSTRWFALKAVQTRVREGGEATKLFLHCRNCDSLAVVVVAHFDPHLAGCHLAATGRTDDCFCHF